jgi:hypothetical protein
MTLVIIGACGMPHGPDIADSVRNTGWGFRLHWPGPCRSEVTKSDFVVFGDVLGGAFGSKAQDQGQGQGSQVVDRCIEALAGVHGDDDGADDGGAAGGIGRGDAKRPLKDHPTVLETPRK